MKVVEPSPMMDWQEGGSSTQPEAQSGVVQLADQNATSLPA
jgi:hypothetical protein